MDKAPIKNTQNAGPLFHGVYGDSEASLEKRAAAGDRPVVGVLFHNWEKKLGDTLHIDALCAELERQGYLAIPVYSSILAGEDGSFGGLRETFERFFADGSRVLIDALVAVTGYSMSISNPPREFEDGGKNHIFKLLNVPVIQAMTTEYTAEEWERSYAGIRASELAYSVYDPELDGQIIVGPIASREKCGEDEDKKHFVPIKRQIELAASLAGRWAALHRKPMQEKKLAIILHNMPPRADMIGCAYGLDTPASLTVVLRALSDEGLRFSPELADGKAIINRFTQTLTNDCRFKSPEDMLAGAGAVIEPAQYLPWFKALPPSAVQKMLQDWGKCPGEIMTVDDKIVLPCIRSENLLIGIQPPRGDEQMSDDLYHSRAVSCPYQYLAFYNYIEEVFKADAIVHFGTHGTLEWLPGKEVGLSADCFPSLAIRTMPHIYPYIIDVPGEGVQARRRSSAVLVDHMIPSIRESGLYGELYELDEAISEYGKCTGSFENRQKLLEDIRRQALALKLEEDVPIPPCGSDDDMWVEKLHNRLTDIKNSKIKDGLHIFGKVPPKTQLSQMVRSLVEVENGDVLSITEAAEQALKADERDGGASVEEIVSDLMTRLEECGYNSAEVNKIIRDILPEECLSGSTELARTMDFICGTVYPKLMQIPEELTAFVDAVKGKFILPGASGAPTRGNVHILPTGRNAYTLDPDQIPTKQAWDTGIKMAEQFIDKYKTDNGELPKSVSMVVFANEVMQTGGDEIAEILWLYGVRPLRMGNGNKVIGLELIPLKELGRPRIDVTMRISGLFRDTFPGLISLLDKAVNLAAAADEPEELNYVKQNVNRDIGEFIKSGIGEASAKEKAQIRMFGCPSGSYGAGIDSVIESKSWNDNSDLGEVYMDWSCHAYSDSLHGEDHREQLKKRLSSCDATVINLGSAEFDILDTDDYYIYSGGLNSAINTVKGSQPVSYVSDTAKPTKPVIRDLQEETSRIIRAKIANPAWAEGLRRHGYKGAQEVSAAMDILFGWDASAEVVKDWMYDTVYQTFIENEENLRWMNEENPWAVHAVSERLLEAIQRNMWEDADDRTIFRLQELYLKSEALME